MIRRRSNREKAILAAFDPPIDVHAPETLTSPVIFASPHSGDIYPEDFIESAAVPFSVLRRNEDAYVDQLFAPATEYGAPFLRARFPRCFVDVNRAPDELPSAWRKSTTLSTQRAEMGLGVIPTMISEREPIYKRRPRASVVEGRLSALYHPYHDALDGLIRAAQAQFGLALVIDCHSMPGFTQQGSRRSDMILGDRYGVSCDASTLALVDRLLSARGYSVTRNYPYAGGYVASHYGRPMDGVEVIQIEINRDLYLNPVTLKTRNGFERLKSDMRSFTSELIENFRAPKALAAE